MMEQNPCIKAIEAPATGSPYFKPEERGLHEQSQRTKIVPVIPKLACSV
jgi:hypothetical protein